MERLVHNRKPWDFPLADALRPVNGILRLNSKPSGTADFRTVARLEGIRKREYPKVHARWEFPKLSFMAICHMVETSGTLDEAR